MEHQSVAKTQKSPNTRVQRQSRCSPSTQHGLIALQSSVGNHAVQRLIQSSYIQTKLQVSTPGDPFEQEADHVADTVMRAADPAPTNGTSQHVLVQQITPFIHRNFDRKGPKTTSGTDQPRIVQRRTPPLAVREDDDEERLARMPDTTELADKDRDKFDDTSLEHKKTLQRQTREDDEFSEEKVQAPVPIQRQLEDEEEQFLTPKIEPGELIQRLCTECELEHQKEQEEPAAVVQRTAGTEQPQAGSDLQRRLTDTKGGGRSLPHETRSFFESALGADFSGVQVHTGAEAVAMNKELGAHAFTHGSDIYFNAGKYDPGSSSGKRLLAHELTHTVQQGGAVRTKKESDAAASVSLKTDSPAIHGDWYNFNIPFTDYQFDPSLEGIKTAAGVVKDTAVAGVEWIVDEIKSLVSSGISWLQEKWESLKEFVSSGWESLKSAFTEIVSVIKSPLDFIANAILNFDADSLRAAWARFSGFVAGIGKSFKAATDHLFEQVEEVWGGISGSVTRLLDRVTGLTRNFLFEKLPDALQQIAFAVINQLKSLWKSISDGFNSVINKVRTWVNSAIDTVLEFVNRVTSFAIDVVIAGIIQFGKLVLFLKDLFENPDKYINILAEKSVAVFDGLESRFAGVVDQYFGDEKNAAPATDKPVTIQRDADPAAAPAAKSSASWGDIGSGVWQAMKDKWEEFKKNPLSIVTGLLLDMFVPIYGNVKDIIELFVEIKDIVTGPLGAGSLEEFWTSLLLILDIPILIYQKVVSILMRSLMLPLIVATFIPHPLVKAIAAAVGEALLAMFVEAELLNVGHKILLLKTGALTKEQKISAYNRIADTLIALIMTGVIILVMLILHFIANVMKGIYQFVKGKFVRIEVKPIEAKGGTPEGKGGGPEGKGEAGPEEGKTGEGRTGKEVPSEDHQRKIKINEEGKCEVCASPCEEVRKKYGRVMTKELEGKIKAIEDAKLSEAEELKQLEPVEQKLADLAKGTPETGPYSDIKDNTKIEPGRPFQDNQKAKILDANRAKNGGKLMPDNPADPWFGKELEPPPKGPFEPGKFPEVPDNQAQVDHRIPRIGPDGKPLGTNAYPNAEVGSKEYNSKKSNKL